MTSKSFLSTFFKKVGGIIKGATLDTGFLRVENTGTVRQPLNSPKTKQNLRMQILTDLYHKYIACYGIFMI